MRGAPERIHIPARRLSGVPGLALLFLLCCSISAAADSEGFSNLLELVRRDAPPESLERSIREGLERGGPARSGWETVRLWNLARIDSAGFVRALADFRRAWPQSRYLPYGRFLHARLLASRGGSAAAAMGLLDLLSGDCEEQLELRARRLLVRLLEGPLSTGGAKKLLARRADRSSRRWLEGWIRGRRIHRRFAAVLPLKGDDAARGRSALVGLETALSMWSDSLEPGAWRMELLDSESDALRAHVLLEEHCRPEDLDFALNLGKPAYAAAASFGSSVPVIHPWYEGVDLPDADPALYQLNADPATLGRALADLAVDSLEIRAAVTLAPATLPGARFVEEFNARLLDLDSLVELGAPQWYFPGAQDLRRQMENLSIYESSFDTLAAVVVFATPGELPVLLPQLAYADPRGLVLGNSPFLEGLRIPELATLENQLLVLSDWLPVSNLPHWRRFVDEFRRREGRLPEREEALAYESLRLMMECGRIAELSERSFRMTLEDLSLPSSFGGRLLMDGRSNSHLLLMSFDGRRFVPLGGLDTREEKP